MKNISRNVSKEIFCICLPIVLCAIEVKASTLPPDPNNAALLYYQAFLLCPEPDYVTNEVIRGFQSEDFDKYLKSGKLQFGNETEEDIREVEEIKSYASDPNSMMPELHRMMPEGQYENYMRSGLYHLHERLEHEQKMSGVDPNKTIRDYMRDRRGAIELAQAASEIPRCDWGLMYSHGIALGQPQLIKIRDFAISLRVDALLLAVDGNYREAFERCLTMRRFARHVGRGTYLLYCISQDIDYKALNCIRWILGHIKPDACTLAWLKNQLALERTSLALPARVLEIDFELALQSLRTNADILEKARQAMILKEELKALMKEQRTEETESPGEIQTLTDEELVTLAAGPYETFLNSALRIIESEMSYEQKSSEIESLTEKINNEYGQDPASFPILAAHPEKMLTLSIVMACADQVSRAYQLQVRQRAFFNALMAGIEIYLINANAGRLPEALPQGLPKDPFSGKDFDYNVTEEGFILRCRAKSVNSRNVQQYEFKVRR